MKMINAVCGILVISHLLCVAQPPEWVVPGEDVQTIYFQGMKQSQRQCGKYCGERGMVATTGERVIYPGANALIRNPFIGKELDEVMLKNGPMRAWYHPLRLIDRLQHRGFTRQLQKYGAQVVGTKLGMPTVLTHAIDVFKLNFGQKRDIDEHTHKVTLCDQQHAPRSAQGVPKILWGVSRGAAVAFNAHAQHKYGNVKMVVLEGCFDTVERVIESRTPRLMKLLRLHTFFHYLLAATTEYKTNGHSPVTSVDSFPEGVPVVFVTSKVDTKVPKHCTDSVVNKLRARGKNPVHYLELEESTHNVYALGNGKDQRAYRTFLHRLYKQYNLPHVAQYAQ